MIRVLAALAVVTLLLAGAVAPARAEVTIAGWAVSSKPDEDGDCTATREYTDTQDGGSSKAVVLFVVGKTDRLQAIVVSMGYSGWNSRKATVKADLRIDDAVVVRDATWQIGETTAAASLSDVEPVAAALGRGKVLEFEAEGVKRARFDIAGAGRALGAVQFCQQRG